MKKMTIDVDVYLASLPADIRSDMQTLDKNITAHMPGASRRLWQGVFWGGSEQTIIGYGDLTFVGSNKKPVEWFMVGLAKQKDYFSVYISATEDGQYVAKKYGSQLGRVKVGSSSISFKKLTDVNLDELWKLVDIAQKQL